MRDIANTDKKLPNKTYSNSDKKLPNKTLSNKTSSNKTLSNKTYRELLETKNVFADPKYCREAWKGIGMAVLLSESNGMVVSDGKEGEIEEYTYAKLSKELKDLGRKPTELEMILHCQAAKARWDTSAAIFMRDTVGAKPVDESKVTVERSQYEEMSDDELEALLRYRQSKGTYTVDTYTHADVGSEVTVDGADTHLEVDTYVGTHVEVDTYGADSGESIDKSDSVE